jgi:hypothetical protein
MKKILISLCAVSCLSIGVLAKPTTSLKPSSGLNKTAAGCNATTAVIDLDINNVRARLMNGGDMWWDIPTGTAQYEVPKGSKKTSLFAGSIWIGGIDNTSKDIKVAAQTYRQSGNDYWAGPLDQTSAEITVDVCAEWDRFWKVNASEINSFRSIYAGITDQAAIRTAVLSQQSNVAKVIKEWPAQGNQDVIGAQGSVITDMPNRPFADFKDVDGIPGYDWRGGDYPVIVGDQYIWWIFNDKGDVKQNTQSESLNLEIHASAFAFATNDCLNDATFNNYRVYTKGSFTIDSTYMATFSDADLGAAFDDFIGCDTARGLGILYNGDAFDEGVSGYAYDIPMVGVDYFQGPKYPNPTNPSLPPIELKMTSYAFFTNGGGSIGDPNVKGEYYNYMRGLWADGQPMYTSANARDNNGQPTKFAYTGDPCKGGWSEVKVGNTPDDRRFVHSSGPFTMIPGTAPQNITIGAVWVPSVGGGASACFSKIQICDDKAQKLFENDFVLPNGPNAPRVTIQPLNNKLVFDLDNEFSSNNYKEGYGTNLSEQKFREVAKKVAVKSGNPDSLYQFEGYIVYQLKNSGISISDLRNKDGSVNTEKAKIVFQCDKKNGVTDILNFEVDPQVSPDYYIPRLMVSGKDNGIQHSFQITKDFFATGTSTSLVNYKTYYYIVVAYAHNEFSAPNAFDKDKIDSLQDIRYLESRSDGRGLPIRVFKAIPHPATDNLYTQTYADYNTGIQLKRIEGIGNGGNGLILTQESEREAVSGPNYQSFNPTYVGNFGPMSLKVVNPDSIKAGDYEVWFNVKKAYTGALKLDTITGFTTDSNSGAFPDSSTWFIRNIATGDTVYSDVSIATFNEKYLRKYGQFDWGLSAGAQQQVRPGDRPLADGNGYIGSGIFYADNNKAWLFGVKDEEGKSFNNWLRSGSDFPTGAAADPNYPCTLVDWDNESGPKIKNRDVQGKYESVMDGTWGPYNLTTIDANSKCGFGLQFGSGTDRIINKLQDVNSIDVVFTSDKKLWSRCPVLEMTDNAGVSVAEGKAFKFNLRRHLGWNGDIDGNGKPVYSTNPADSGMSYFPGYAINLETGERLNICFGEESQNLADNGADLIFNPTSNQTDNFTRRNLWGGKHVIYVSREKYNAGATLASVLKVPTTSVSNNQYRAEFKKMVWVGIPLLFPGSSFTSLKDGLIPTFTRVSIRVTRPYAKYQPNPAEALRNNGWPLYTFSTKDIAPAKLGDVRNVYTNDKQKALERIYAVPNPYYAVSDYETGRLDNRVKIINLPDRATIKIYSIDGTLIKTITKTDNPAPYVDWDIKNDKGLPIASGMYLIHVNIPDVGETIVKWFGAMRPIDITQF